MTIKIHNPYIGESYYNDTDKRQFLKGVEKLQLEFERGDKIRIVNHIGIESKTELDQCLPGCETKNVIDNLFKNECSVEIAKRDMVKFKKNYIKVLKNALSLGEQEHNVIDHIISLDDFYRGRNIDNRQTLFFILYFQPVLILLKNLLLIKTLKLSHKNII